MPEDYSPFNIQWIEGRLYVAYAVVDQAALAVPTHKYSSMMQVHLLAMPQ
jgi:hypothetical protein